MDLDTFIITVFCEVDDMLPSLLGGKRFRSRGPDPTLSDSEVLTIEMVGEFPGLDQDKAIFDYFRCHYSHFLPGPSSDSSRHFHQAGGQPMGPEVVTVATYPGQDAFRLGDLPAR